jgi:hypothetical protein
VDATDIMSIVLRGAVGRRGRKRARRAVNFLTGHRGFLTASTVLGAAGVAWGIYDSLKSGGPGASGAPAASGSELYPGATAATGAVPPPIPGTAVPAHGTEAGVTPVTTESRTEPDASGAAVLPNDLVRIVRLAVSAARADGTLSPQERELILQHARDAGVESTVEQELDAPRPLADIVSGVNDAQRRQDLYVLAYTIVRADEAISGAERIYLAQLAHQLSLDAATVARLEQDTATKIDTTPE